MSKNAPRGLVSFVSLYRHPEIRHELQQAIRICQSLSVWCKAYKRTLSA